MFGFGSMDESLGEIVFIGSRRFEVIGVVDDYHYRSLQYAIEPILYIQGYRRNPAYAIKVPTERLPELLPIIEGLWTDAYSGNVFTYNFLDDRFNEQYLNDRRVSSLIGMFTIMAAFISGAGFVRLITLCSGSKEEGSGYPESIGRKCRSSNRFVVRRRDPIDVTERAPGNTIVLLRRCAMARGLRPQDGT
jgi:putative ABC transport system permease protein